MFTIEEPLAQRGLPLLDDRHDRGDCSLRKINACHRLLDLQCSMLQGLGIDLVPIIETKRDVAVFLNLKNDQVAQRMHGPCGDEDGIAGGWDEACEMVGYG